MIKHFEGLNLENILLVRNIFALVSNYLSKMTLNKTRILLHIIDKID